MIVAAGLSPAWQQIVILDGLAVGEVNRVREVHWCASGKVLNVGRALGVLAPPGEAAPRTLALAGGAGGETLRREFANDGLPARWIESQAPTRVCTTILDRQSGQTTELVENAGAINDGELAAFRDAFAEEARDAQVSVLTGSLPAGTPQDFYAQLMRQTAAHVVLDCQGTPLLAALAERPFVVKPNREELGRTLGRDLNSEQALHAAMRELHRLGAAWVVVSQGKGRVWLSSTTQLLAIDPPQVESVNPIGSGDCLAAGIATGLSAGYDLPASAVLGVAAAAENVRHLLPARMSRDEVRERAKTLAIVDGAP